MRGGAQKCIKILVRIPVRKRLFGNPRSIWEINIK
jgi:hypothetical protein